MENQQQMNTLNGVNVDALVETVNAVTQNQDMGHFKFRAENHWMDGGHNRSTILGFYGCGREDQSRTEPFVLDADEPPVLLGQDAGANPVEYILHALAGCMTTSMVYHAAARGVTVEAVDSDFEGDLDLSGFLGINEEVRKGYQAIRVCFRVKTTADISVLKECVEFSPVYEMIGSSVPVLVDITTY